MAGEVIQLVIPGAPCVKSRARKGQHGNFYTPTPTQAHEDAVAMYARAAGVRLKGDAGIKLTARFFCHTKNTPDLDNLLKALLDGLQKGELFENDRQIEEIHAMRFDKQDDPRTEVEVEWL